MMESFGDAWGREIRYGGSPKNPDEALSPDSEMTRRGFVDQWKGMSEPLQALAKAENRLAAMRRQESSLEEQNRIDEQVESINGQVREVRRMVLEVCETLQQERRR